VLPVPITYGIALILKVSSVSKPLYLDLRKASKFIYFIITIY